MFRRLQFLIVQAWQGGPFVQVPRVVSARWGQEWYLPNVDASITQLEVMMPSLPDIRVVGFVPALGSSNDYVVRLGVDMTQGGQCTSAIQARARLYFRVRALLLIGGTVYLLHHAGRLTQILAHR